MQLPEAYHAICPKRSRHSPCEPRTRKDATGCYVSKRLVASISLRVHGAIEKTSAACINQSISSCTFLLTGHPCANCKTTQKKSGFLLRTIAQICRLTVYLLMDTSDNAVRTQTWIAVSVYVLVAIVKKRLGLEASLYTLLQAFSVTLFEKMLRLAME